MRRILVVEDDETIRQVVCEFLKAHDYQVEAVTTGEAALEKIYEQTYHLVLLDIMLPKMSGIEVLKTIRSFSSVPVIMMTAMADEYTQLMSFNYLINDYVTKPFSPMVLMKRIENVFRQVQGESSLKIGDLEIHQADHTVIWQGSPVHLTKKEYGILLALMRKNGQLIGRENLMDDIWGHSELDSRVLDNHVKNIRKKLPGLPLKTVTGIGYLLGVSK